MASMTRCAPASSRRAHSTPGTSVEPRPAPAKVAMNRRRVVSSDAIKMILGAVNLPPAADIVCDKTEFLAGAIHTGGPAHDGRLDSPQLPAALVGRAHLEYWHVDAEGGA